MNEGGAAIYDCCCTTPARTVSACPRGSSWYVGGTGRRRLGFTPTLLDHSLCVCALGLFVNEPCVNRRGLHMSLWYEYVVEMCSLCVCARVLFVL